MGQRSSLFCPNVSGGEESFLTLTPDLTRGQSSADGSSSESE